MVKETRELALGVTYKFMSLLALVYLIKFVAKVDIGDMVHSPVLEGEGYHSASDFFAALMIMLSMWIQNRPPTRKFPFGLYNVQSLLQVGVYFSMIFLAFEVFQKSVVGILHLPSFVFIKDAMENHGYFLPKIEHLIVDQKYFWVLFGTMFVSGILSFIMGRKQIAIGKRSHQDAVVADGEETINDGYIEMGVAIGILGEYRLGFPWLEYPVGLVLTYLILDKAKEIGAAGAKKLLQAGVEDEILTRIYGIAETVHGVDKVEPIENMRSFRTGSGIVCNMKITTSCCLEAHGDIKLAVAHKVGGYFTREGLGDFEYYIRFEAPDKPRKRIAYAVTVDRGVAVVSSHLLQATHLRICDMVGDEITRPKDVPIPCRPGLVLEDCLNDVAAILRDKYTETLYSFGFDDHLFEEERIRLASRGVTLKKAPSFSFAVM